MEWRALLQRLDFSGKLGKTEALELLRALRKTNLRRPDVVLQLGPVVEASVSEAERMLLYEQMFLAALDMKLEDKAEQYLAHLASAFPDSSRVLKLQGMQQEARGNYDMAMAVYDKLLLENPANISVLQRTAATYKAQGNLVEALSELNKILELSSADASVWSEVAEIHIRLSNYAEAAFCLEEMVLIDPSNHVTCTKLADLYYTLGGLSNLLRARQHYVASLNILKASINTRALYSLLLCCQSIGEIVTANPEMVSAEELAVNSALCIWAKEQAHGVADKSTANMSLLRGLLANEA